MTSDRRSLADANLRGLPIDQLAIPPDSNVPLWVTTTVDHSGRLADRSPLRYLGWTAGSAVRVRVHDDFLVSAVLGSAPHTVTMQGYLRLPLAVRRRCRIDARDRLLVAAWRDPGRLVICTAPVLGVLLGARLSGTIRTAGGRDPEPA